MKNREKISFFIKLLMAAIFGVFGGFIVRDWSGWAILGYAFVIFIAFYAYIQYLEPKILKNGHKS